MMRYALSAPELSEATLKWNCVDHLNRIEDFIKAASE
jgi:hypothetical protein